MPKPLTAAIYARVSTTEQDYAMQLHDLRKYVQRQGWNATEYCEKESSMKRRPQFLQMLADAKAGKLDVILVWRIDRFARSMKDFVFTTLELASCRVRLISITENVDTGDDNPFAKFTRQLLAILAELERNIIVARVNAGLAQAKRDGRQLGRPKRVFSRPDAVRLQKQGLSIRQIAGKLGVSRMTVARVLGPVPKTPLQRSV